MLSRQYRISHMETTTIVMPGDGIAHSLPPHGIVQLGSGVDIRQSSHIDKNILSATEVGVLRTKGSEESGRKGDMSSLPGTHVSYTVASLHKKSYTHPSIRDAVIGCIMKTGAEYYEVDIRATTTALLPVLGFDNATKRNRPMLKVGDVVYGKIIEVDGIGGGGYAVERMMMDCCNGTHGDGFGPLYVSPVSSSTGGTSWTGSTNNSGMLFKVTPAYARFLLSSGGAPESTLAILGSRIPFEIVIGVNGLFWISSQSSSSSSAHLETSIVGTVIQCMERDNDVSPQRVLSVLERQVKSSR